MMSFPTFRAVAVCAAMALAAAPALAQDSGATRTADEMRTAEQVRAEEVRAEVSEAMDAVAEYSAQERDEALARAGDALERLDAEIERREQALRENWSEMSESARESAREQVRDLRQARNRLGERYGALQSGAASAWDELKAGFSGAWTALSDAWNSADGDASSDGNAAAD